MSFLELIQNEKDKAEQQDGNQRVEMPQTKHQKLFFGKNDKEKIVQILPSASLVDAFSKPIRTIFLEAKTSTGKEIRFNFTLDAQPNEGSLLENKIEEWAEKEMITNYYGNQQRPGVLYLVNAVNIVEDANGNLTQERDDKGNLVVRVFEMKFTAYKELLKKLTDKMLNVSGTDLSFMDVNKPSPVKVTKPNKGETTYSVDVYNNIILPPLGEGWENQLEDLEIQGTPTERLENGQNWVEVFVNLKEGKNPNTGQGQAQGGQQQTQQQQQTNPYAQGQQGQDNNQGSAQSQGSPMGMPQGQQGVQQPQTFDPNNVQQQQEPQQTQQAPQQQPNSGQQQQSQQAPQQQQQQQQQEPQQSQGNFEGVSEQQLNLGQAQGQGQPQTQQQQAPQPQAQPQQTQQAPQQNQQQAQPDTSQSQNQNGLSDINAMLEKELNGGN